MSISTHRMITKLAGGGGALIGFLVFAGMHKTMDVGGSETTAVGVVFTLCVFVACFGAGAALAVFLVQRLVPARCPWCHTSTAKVSRRGGHGVGVTLQPSELGFHFPGSYRESRA